MRSVTGSILLMTLPDILQWSETNRKSGTLTLKQENMSKVFYLQDGKIIFISSQKPGEQLGEFFAAKGGISLAQMSTGLRESQRLGVPFTGYLISEGIIAQKPLEKLIQELAETAFTEALTWTDGIFEFTDTLPTMVVNGPVQINASSVLFQSVKQIDESPGMMQSDTRMIIAEVAQKISSGQIEIPPVPMVMQKLNSMLQRDDTPVHDIVEVITADQILTAKILKVVNSAFYSPIEKITSLRQAIVFMGLKSVLSIAAVHTISGFGAKNAEKIKGILHHSLLCAFIARRIAAAEGQNVEEAFACGLLHDIGKTVILNATEGLALKDDDKAEVLREYHESAGYLVTTKWNFAEVLQVSAGFHHHPEQAPAHVGMVQTVFLADLLANRTEIPAATAGALNQRLQDTVQEVDKDFASIQENVDAVL